MGIYLVSVAADDWDDEEVLQPTARALSAELTRLKLPPLAPPRPYDFVPGSGTTFEEKLNRPMGSFSTLCRTQPDGQDHTDALLGWELLLPISLPRPIELRVPSLHPDTTIAQSAHTVLAAAQTLADQLALPPQIPAYCDNLNLTNWFAGTEVQRAAQTHPGPWQDNLDAAFYTAVYLRAAEHSLRNACPLHYS
ncbi:hypothetical protein [Streptomyces melanogenes]|uniref:Uncharacterized protein n=1 Tax=Streptomyces melanogenes TaxID=67326 RepID=A0ABZ1XV20_9ACTN|nr:hypothetical protein [Streptomyces melanogenes]